MLKSISRRQFAGGLCACGVAIGPGGAANAQSDHVGCHLTAEQFEKWVAPTASEFAFSDDRLSMGASENHSGSSGDRMFDQALAVTLAKLSKTFGVLPSFSFFSEPGGYPNAYASTQVRVSNRQDGAVAYGRNLLQEQMSNEVPNLGDVVGVCAHEFAHILQFKRGAVDDLRRISNGSVFRVELHADFLAGYFGGLRKLEKPDFPAAELALGMFAVGDYSYDSPGHHGTPKQRGEAVRQGFKYAFERKASFNEAYQAGFQFAKAQKLQN